MTDSGWRRGIDIVSLLRKKVQRFLPLTFRHVKPTETVDVSRYAALPAGYHGSNPSIVPYNDGFLISLRGINYVFDQQDMDKTIYTAGTTYHTFDRFFLVDQDFKLKRNIPELDQTFDNVEDIKLFTLNGKIMGVGSLADPSQGKGACNIVLLEFNSDLTDGNLKIIPSPFGLRQEKNWAPFVVGDVLHFVYSFSPLIVVKYNSEANSIAMAHPVFERFTRADLRFLIGGSSAGIPFNGGYLFAAHRRRVSLPGFERLYISRLYHLDASLTGLTAGRYFTMGPSIQFTNGLVFRRGDLVLAYGGQANRDAHAHLCVVNQQDVMPKVA